MGQKKLADSFIGAYQVSKTLRFELRPVGKTLENIERDGIIDADIVRGDNYAKAKKYIDEYHRDFIQRTLENVTLDLADLEVCARLYNKKKRTAEENKALAACQKNLRGQVSDAFTKAPEYETINKKKLFTHDLPAFFRDDQEKMGVLSVFEKSTTYFTDYHKIRMNLYTAAAKQSAIGNRIVHDNLPKYARNMKAYSMLKETVIAESLDNLNTRLSEVYDDFGSIEDYFVLEGFNNVLTQTGIDKYNTIIGGYAVEGGEKIQGLNELINLYNQKNKTKLPKLSPLFKQLLSGRGTVSYIPEKIKEDSEVFDAIDAADRILTENIFECVDSETVESLFSGLAGCDLDKIYVNNGESISAISKSLYGEWYVIKNAIAHDYERRVPVKRMSPGRYAEKMEKELKKVKSYSIGELNRIMESDSREAVVEQFFSRKAEEILDAIDSAREKYYGINREKYGEGSGKHLKNCDADILKIKEFLDSLKALQDVVRPISLEDNEEAEKDDAFYEEFSRIAETLSTVTPLYDKARNYVTAKPYSDEKIKLNFGTSTLLDGWDKDLEQKYLGSIFMKDGQYFLGILNRERAGDLGEPPAAVSANVYRKMVYKQVPDPSKMLPKVFLTSKTGQETYKPSEELLEKYKKNTHKDGANFSLEDCRALIDYYKQCIAKNEKWKCFGFRFSDTASYSGMSDFYDEVSSQGYLITFRDVDADYIDRLVSEGALYLFHIYNKDFSRYSSGTPNLHTLYWKALFSPENLDHRVYKLNGGAEVFFRRASIKKEDIITHPAGIAIANKDPMNEKKESLFEYTLVKDKRYTRDKFMFHVPITINCLAGKAGKLSAFNLRVNKAIREAEDMHIIGIDRGERNLLYVSVIDMEGRIVEQMSLNEILSCGKDGKPRRRDYHELLDRREKENTAAQKNWTTINSIKELKKGYISQAVHVITELMIKYNAVVVMEDLNFGFKNGRKKIEKQVYQKIEEMLIDKLNLYANKRKGMDENGGIMKPYQLTARFTSFQALDKQSGFLYYIPAWNTSSIDPTTGFVNLLRPAYKSAEKAREFIMKMDDIRYDEETGCYAFSFDYSNFTAKAEGSKTNWTVYSYGRRIDHFRNPAKNSEWDVRYVDLTKAFDDLFAEYSVSKNTGDMREAMADVKKAEFFSRFMKLMSLTLQMRNSDEKNGIDEIVSPVKNGNGTFFVTGTDKRLPLDADANGAYNIAKKGLWAIRKIRETDEDDLENVKLAVSNREWLQFAQENTI